MNAQFEIKPLASQLPHLARAAIFSVVWVAIMLPSSAMAAKPATQRYVVHVPVSSRVLAPADSVVLTSVDEKTQAFPEQSWTLDSNSPTGLVADFSVDQAFSSDLHPAVKRDAQLSVRVTQASGKGKWITTREKDSTTQSTGDEDARVQVRSTAGGSAEVSLQVSLAEDANVTPATSYQTTVYCTITTP